jgi:microcystin-dependent protein
MPYTISFSDPSKSSTPITVNDLTANNTSTSLSLVGRNYSNYGVAVASNFVRLLENFASPTAPNNSIEGQLWYDNSRKRLFVNDSTGGASNWRPAGGTHVAPTSSTPQNAILGDLWVNTLTQQLNLYNGTDWILVGPTSLSGKKTGLYVEEIEDSSGINHFVTIEYNNDVAVRITASETFFPQRAIDGFLQIRPGINITSAKFFGPADTTVPNTIAKIYGVTTSAESLNVTSPSIATVSADNFARRDVGNLYYGLQSILNDSGVTIGTASNFSLTVNQGSAVIKNAYDQGSIDIVVSNQGAQNVIVKVDGKNKRVGINHPTPNVELDVNGSAYINGHLTMTGSADSTSPSTGSFQSRGGAGIAKNLYVGKNIVSSGHIRVGEIDDSGVNISGPAIVPSAHLLYDIGTSTLRFKTVYAENFNGAFSGSFSGTVTGSVIGAATSLQNSTNFQITGDTVSTAAASFTGAGGTLTINTALSDNSFRAKTEVVDNRVDDTILIYRANTGLRRVTRTNFLLGEAFVPIGSIFPFAATQVPLGYLLCDGALVSRTEYPFLFQAIGTTYGSAAGGAYFRLPDLRGRFPLGNAGMANSLSNVIYTRTVLYTVTTSNEIFVNSTENIVVGMVVTGDSGLPNNTLVTEILSSTSVRISNTVSLTLPKTLTFTLRVLRTPIANGTIDRVSSSAGNSSPSTVGGEGGLNIVTINSSTTGSSPIYTPPGSAQSINSVVDIPVTNPFLTINYIIRVGVGSTQSA